VGVARIAARAAAIVWTLVLLAFLWSPPPRNPRWNWEWLDETVHCVLFFGFAIAWSVARLGLRRVAIAGVALAIVTELVQPWLPWERTAQLGDVVADVVGLLVGLAPAALVRMRRR
jgi:VanZ family protein